MNFEYFWLMVCHGSLIPLASSKPLNDHTGLMWRWKVSTSSCSFRQTSGNSPVGQSEVGGYSLVVFPDIWMIHLLSLDISLELKGRTLTATLTEAPAMAPLQPKASEEEKGRRV